MQSKKLYFETFRKHCKAVLYGQVHKVCEALINRHAKKVNCCEELCPVWSVLARCEESKNSK